MGTRQGSVHSPLLFLIMMSDFPESIDTVTSLYADDSAVWKSGDKQAYIRDKLQSHLIDIQQWCEAWGFKINVKKTIGIIFTKQCFKILPRPFKLGKEIIEIKSEAKFLGQIFYTTLSRRQHAAYIKTRCQSTINLMCILQSKKWGARTTALLCIYIAMIRSIAYYGSELFHKIMDKIMNSIQSQCLWLCTEEEFSTPIIALQNECGEVPLSVRDVLCCFEIMQLI